MKREHLTHCLMLILITAFAIYNLQAKNLTKPVTYYVDHKNGDDSQSGSTEKQAWKSLERVNKASFKPGDQILFKRGGKWEGQLVPQGSGSQLSPITIGTYDKGPMPAIAAAGKFRDVILLKNLSNIIVQDLDLSNTDSTVREQKTGPTGVRVMAEDIGTISNIKLTNLYIHDINGDNKKGSKEGHGIFWDCQGPKQSNIENLQIEYCKVVRVDRNGIRGNGTFAFRDNWFPNKNLIIRNCSLKDIGGDGIVIKGFDGSVIEHNKLFHIRTRARDNAVGIWPHSSDNTLIQFNEVAFTKNQDWSNDGQSFDIDGNCNNTIIQNNYSHDNEGGFMLVISDAINAKSSMTKNSIIRNNLSINDGHNRKRLFNFALVTDSTLVSGNLFYNDSKDMVNMELIDIEHGVPKNVIFENNIFHYGGNVAGIFTKSDKQYVAITWKGNCFDGNITGKNKLLNVTESKTSLTNKDTKQYPWNLLKKLKVKMH
ncbi:hypothetical protein CPT03_16245 [Pedobacter ginsengisoli]|uniref:Right handed beta helix domain-containing protein n=1 Tax=Pedobacter ginsengisoli TaxID=363852 RepID=A0A2D1U8E6_9SPHI|nr:right-handed parallel beta-helix repeat-containing protein [Pedobacter ginsengisoli]ATP57897.1 hypothetical protein CPT03_16245 [Pedobacter ginsengisoli]